MASTNPSRSRVPNAINDRRIELNLQWDEVADKAGMSTAHLRRFRKGETELSELLQARLEDALGWTRGSIKMVEAGGDPIPHLPTPPPTSRSDVTLGEMLLERRLARIEELTEADNIRNDPVAWEIVEMDELSEETRDRWLQAYGKMRREIFEAVRSERQQVTENKRPRV